jgi:hypothetical protein
MFHDEMVYLERLANSDPIPAMLVYDQISPAERCKLLLVVIKYCKTGNYLRMTRRYLRMAELLL